MNSRTPSVSSPEKADLFAELPTGKRYLLRELPEEVIKPYLERKDLKDRVFLPSNDIYYSRDKLILVYNSGKLLRAIFDHPEDLFKFSPTLEGPYLKLPTDRVHLERVFGEPLRWEDPGHYGPRF